MGVEEIVLLLAAQQFAQAIRVYLAKIKPSVTNPFATAAIAVGIQLAANVSAGCAAGGLAANAEFATTNASEKTVVAALAALPPIT